MKILHWYYDIMNLYGEYGNIKILEKYLKRLSDDITIEYKSIGDNVTLSEYDCIYVGSGTERNQLVVLEDMRNYVIDIKRYIDDNKILLATGNAWEIFGQEINIKDNKKIQGLQIFDYIVNRKNDKVADNILCETHIIDKKVIGCINKIASIYNVKTPLFKVISGIPNNENENTEGFIYNNFYGTHIIEPLLIKNPFLLEYIIKKLCENNNIKFNKLEIDEYEIKSYEVSLKEIEDRLNK